MITEQKAANVFRGKTARACESCVRKRARWYCAADDAFLCHVCDTLVHSANQLAGRHERVRLESASSSKVSTSVTTTGEKNKGVPQAWYNGFTRKARTPRPSKASLVQQAKSTNTLPVVPELGCEEQAVSDENDEQMLYRVPVFDPFEADICNLYHEDQESDQRRLLEIKTEASLDVVNEEENMCDLDNFSEFLSSDVDLAEFAADVESLLTKSQDDDDSREKQDLKKTVEKEAKTMEFCTEASRSNAKVKEEDDEGKTLLDSNLEVMLDMSSCETMNWNFDYESLVTGAEEEYYKFSAPAVASDYNERSEYNNGKKSMFLRLNYEEVITAWASQGSPWTTGHPPEISPHSGWPDFLGTSTGSTVQRSGTGMESLRGHSGGDAGREARVSRYREKRRTRLFAKKIRYEVRKLNAESRPRMKGRFVKRTTFMEDATSFPYC